MDDPLNILLEKRSDLVLAFQFNLKELAHLMHAKGFLSDTDHETVTAVRSMVIHSEKADIMLDSLIRKVKLDPNNYRMFYTLVQHKTRKFEDLVKLLAPGIQSSGGGGNIQQQIQASSSQIDMAIVSGRNQQERTHQVQQPRQEESAGTSVGGGGRKFTAHQSMEAEPIESMTSSLEEKKELLTLKSLEDQLVTALKKKDSRDLSKRLFQKCVIDKEVQERFSSLDHVHLQEELKITGLPHELPRTYSYLVLSVIASER